MRKVSTPTFNPSYNALIGRLFLQLGKQLSVRATPEPHESLNKLEIQKSENWQGQQLQSLSCYGFLFSHRKRNHKNTKILMIMSREI